MSEVDRLPILIVGNGIAGANMAHSLQKRGVEYMVMDDGHRSSSSIAAAGLYNPLILKRLRKCWQADLFMDGLVEHYLGMEQQWGVKILHQTGLLRRIASVEEFNDWDVRRSDNGYMDHLGEIDTEDRWGDRMDGGVGTLEVRSAGWVDVSRLLKENRKSMRSTGRYLNATYTDTDVKTPTGSLMYDGHRYSAIILCRGYKEHSESRFFPDLPFSPAKGQTMVLHVPGLDLDRPLHVGIFILPIGGDHYRIGSTYSWSGFDEGPESVKREELLKKFTTRCPLPFTVMEEYAGVRPAVKDRRPLLGRSRVDERILLFNGLGSRGIMMAPLLADLLAGHLLDGDPLWPEVDLARFS